MRVSCTPREQPTGVEDKNAKTEARVYSVLAWCASECITFVSMTEAYEQRRSESEKLSATRLPETAR